LSGRCVGIVGCGNVGKELVQLLAPFGCRVLVNAIIDYADFFARHAIERCELDALLSTAHVVSLHVPLDRSTQNLLDARRLGLLRQDAILINTARGGIVDEQALKDRLQHGALAGAGFDVFSSDPPGVAELLALPNFLGTPHIGGSAEEAILAMGRSAIAGLLD
jgi:phosphoglycerate dehydrogenase-like enzyme